MRSDNAKYHFLYIAMKAQDKTSLKISKSIIRIRNH